MTPEDSFGWPLALWIGVLAAVTYALRFSFLALGKSFQFSRRQGRILESTPAAIMFALAAPAIAFRDEGVFSPDPLTLAAAFIAVGVGIWTKKFLWAACAGMVVLIVGPSFL
jgi:branched-subunit amino acid transport protein